MPCDTLIKPSIVAAAIGELWTLREHTDVGSLRPAARCPGPDAEARDLIEDVNRAASDRITVLENLLTVLAPVNRADALALAVYSFAVVIAPKDGNPDLRHLDQAALERMLAALIKFLEHDAGTTAASIGLGAYFFADRNDWPGSAQRALVDAERLRRDRSAAEASPIATGAAGKAGVPSDAVTRQH